MKTEPAAVAPGLRTPKRAAELLECSENHIRRLVASGALTAVDVAQPGARRSKMRIREDHLAAYINACQQVSPERGRAT